MHITVTVSKEHKEYFDKLTKHAVLQGSIFEGLLGIALFAGFSCPKVKKVGIWNVIECKDIFYFNSLGSNDPPTALLVINLQARPLVKTVASILLIMHVELVPPTKAKWAIY